MRAFFFFFFLRVFDVRHIQALARVPSLHQARSKVPLLVYFEHSPPILQNQRPFDDALILHLLCKWRC